MKTSTVRSRRRQASAPDLLEELVAGEDPARLERECIEQPELGGGELDALPVQVGLDAPGIDPELLQLHGFARMDVLRSHAATSGDAHAGDELLHGEWLHEIVVCADLERMNAVLLAPARADDEDRRPDAFAAGGLDHLPAVESRKHEVEDADVRAFEAQAGDAGLSIADPVGVEAGFGKV